MPGIDREYQLINTKIGKLCTAMHIIDNFWSSTFTSFCSIFTCLVVYQHTALSYQPHLVTIIIEILKQFGLLSFNNLL